MIKSACRPADVPFSRKSPSPPSSPDFPLPRRRRSRGTPRSLPSRSKALKKGDTVALIRPASPSYEYEANEMAAEVVAAFGLVPKVMPNAGRKTNYLAGTDAERAADLNAAFADPKVDGVWCISGGYGTSRILPYLDYETIREEPEAVHRVQRHHGDAERDPPYHRPRHLPRADRPRHVRVRRWRPSGRSS